MIRLIEIDPADPALTQQQARLLADLILRRADYISQGRGREAHGVGSAILIVWRHLKFGRLDVELTAQ